MNDVKRINLCVLLITLACNAIWTTAGFAQSSVVAEPSAVAKHAQQIDQLVTEQLKQVRQDRRPSINDYTFCRRVYLDAIGRIPTIDELDLFIAEDQADKRSRLISKFIDSKGY